MATVAVVMCAAVLMDGSLESIAEQAKTTASLLCDGDVLKLQRRTKTEGF